MALSSRILKRRSKSSSKSGRDLDREASSDPAVLDYEDGVRENSKMPSKVLRILQYSTRRARGLARPEHTGLRTWPTSHRIRGGIWPTPYTDCNYS
jgi:hypothetical protein